MTLSKHRYTAGGRSRQHETSDALRVVAKNLIVIANQMTDPDSTKRMLSLAARYHHEAVRLDADGAGDLTPRSLAERR